MRSFACIVGATSLIFLACGDGGDKKAPPPPRIDPLDSPIAKTQVTITGSAEFGATIEMSGAESFEPAEITADPFTARFTVVATLHEGTANMLSFVARDKAGNASEPTLVTVEQEDGHGVPSKLTLDLFVGGETPAAADSVTLAAGDEVHTVATAQDAAGHVLDLPIAISTSIPDAFVAGPDISNIRAAGDFAIAATVAGQSLALSRDVTVTPGEAVSITLDASPASVMAGTSMFVAAEAHDAFGNLVDVGDITLSSEPALEGSYQPPCGSKTFEQGFVDDSHFVAFDLSGVADGSYVFTLTASSGSVSASTQVTVKPGPAARFAPLDPKHCKQGDLFAFTDESWQNDLDEPLSVAAGDTVYYRYGVVDAYGNGTTGPVSVVTTAPGSDVVDDGVSGMGQVAQLDKAGTYQLSAYVAGVAAPAVKSFSVDVADPHSASIYLSSTLASPGDLVYAFVSVRDAYGNVVPCPDTIDSDTIEVLASPADTATGQDTTCQNGVFQRAFTFSENGNYGVSATYKDGGEVSASAFVTILGIDATPPTVTIENLLVDGMPCTLSGTPLGCDVARNSLIELDLVANDNISLSELQYTAFFQTTGQGTLRTRDVLVSGDTVLPASVHFQFNVPGNALQQGVPLVGLAVDGAGNRATTDELVLRVGVYATFGRSVSVVAAGGSINQPNDVAFNASGDMFIANNGNQNLLEIASGSDVPVVFSSYNRSSRYVVVDGSGNVYLTDTTRISRIDPTGATVDNYLQIAGNATEGLALAGATFAKGTINATSANDGATVTVGGQTYELDVSNNGCGGGVVCVAVGGGGKNSSLATSIDANSSVVDAVFDATANLVVLAAKATGEAGNSTTLAASGMTVSGATLAQGHDEELFLGQNNDNNIYRFPETLTPTANASSNHGSWNVGTTQRGVAVKDVSTTANSALRELYLYFIDENNNDRVRGYHAVDSAAPTQVFSTNDGGNFDTLYDVVLEPNGNVAPNNPVNGCLLVSDEATGDIYAIDTRTPTNSSPTVSLVASGFSEPRGLAFHGGALYVADRGDDAIVRLSPSPSASDCF